MYVEVKYEQENFVLNNATRTIPPLAFYSPNQLPIDNTTHFTIISLVSFSADI